MHDLMGPFGPGGSNLCIGPWCQFVLDTNRQVSDQQLPSVMPVLVRIQYCMFVCFLICIVPTALRSYEIESKLKCHTACGINFVYLVYRRSSCDLQARFKCTSSCGSPE